MIFYSISAACVFLDRDTIRSVKGGKVEICRNMKITSKVCLNSRELTIKERQVVRKTFIIDTNVLVHDPSSLKKFKENDIVIPLAVLEELDSLKRHSDEVGKNAREVIRYIDSLKADAHGDFHSGIEIPEGPKIRIHLNVTPERISGFPLPLDRSSNKFLLVSYLLKKEGESVVIVSKDFVTRVKAEAMNLEAEDFENLNVPADEMYRGARTVKCIKKDLDLFFKDGSIPQTEEGFRPNEYAFLTAPDTPQTVCKYSSKTKKLEPLTPIDKDVWGVQPLNMEQKCAMDLLLRDDIPLVSLIGRAGTGKTLLALACGMRKVFDENKYSRILVSRPIMPLGKDIGYLPGTKEEKLFNWMQPIYDNLEFLCALTSGEANSAAALGFVMESKKIEMEAVAYIRGRSLPKIYMIIDEAQNLTPHEIKTVISRAGKGTKVILTGDPSQIDNPYLDKNSNGLSYAVNKFKNHNLFGHMVLERTERSELASLAAEIL